MKNIALVFQSGLSEIERCVKLTLDFRQLGTHAPTKTDLRSSFGRASASLVSNYATARGWEVVVLDGCILNIAAQFELMARDMVEAASHRIAKKCKTYTDLPLNIQRTNIRLVGEFLREYDKARTSHIDFKIVVKDLNVILNKGRPVGIFAQGMSHHQRNLTSTELTELCGRLELRDLWRRVANNPSMMAHFNSSTIDTTADATRNKLNGFMDSRNQIAHRGVAYQTLGPSVILDYIEFFRCLSDSLADTMEAHVRSIP